MPNSARTERAARELLSATGASRLPQAAAVERLRSVIDAASHSAAHHHPSTNEVTNVDDTETRGG